MLVRHALIRQVLVRQVLVRHVLVRHVLPVSVTGTGDFGRQNAVLYRQTRNEETLITVARRGGSLGRKDHSGVDIIAKSAVEYVPPDENSDIRLTAITAGERTVRSPRLGPMAASTGIRDWAR